MERFAHLLFIIVFVTTLVVPRLISHHGIVIGSIPFEGIIGFFLGGILSLYYSNKL